MSYGGARRPPHLLVGVGDERGLGRRRLRTQLDQGRPLRIDQTTSAATLLAEIERTMKKLRGAG